jgi:hypothetical protein
MKILEVIMKRTMYKTTIQLLFGEQFRAIPALLCGLWLLACHSVLAQNALQDQPRILDFQMEEDALTVRAYVPAGFKQVYLEGRARVGEGAWIPRAVIYPEGKEGEYLFHLSLSQEIELLRLRAERETPLEPSAFLGASDFAGPEGSENGQVDFDAPVAAPEKSQDDLLGDGGGAREVVESDIWRIDGDRMYFFNQYRGLQVIDISDAKTPRLMGEMELPAAGEQMYLLDSAYAVLLARNSCSYWGNGAESRLVIVDVTGETPVEISDLPLDGSIQESRLVGSALYVTSQIYRNQIVTGKNGPETIWEYGSQVTSFDLSDPMAPVEKDNFWVPGFQNVIQATSDLLFVSTNGYGSTERWNSTLNIIDISQPDGAMRELSVIRPAGRIIDKFKIDVNNDVLRVISELQGRPVVTELETFDLTNPEKPEKLGSVTLGKNERLHATRFDGDKAYIVTFFQIDPLWVVDLSDPRNPTIAGELEVPGWSTYIQPLGDRLLSIGIDNVDGWRVAVSLFDVADPANPGLLSRVPIGTNHSWSEANSDEKAFGWIPDAGLIMVPFQSYEESQSTTGVQLIELDGDELNKRGIIQHEVAPRRSTLKDDVILSLSGKSLLSVDAGDRDNLDLLSELVLSWRVDHVFAHGDYVLQLADSSAWNATKSALRVGKTDSDFQILSTLDLGDQPVVGSVIQGDVLYLAQSSNQGIPVPVAEKEDIASMVYTFTTKAVDLSQLPEINILSEETVELEEPVVGTDMNPLWINSHTLVWQSSQEYWFWRWGGPFIEDALIADIAPWPMSSGAKFIAFDTAAEVKFLSFFDLDVDEVWNFSDAFSAGGKIYVSYQKNEYEEWLPDSNTNPVPVNRWVQKYFLSVIDYVDPVHPTPRPAISLSGTLQGISHDGSVLITQGVHYDSETLATDHREWLDALAYDGVGAHLVDSIPFSDQWPHIATVTRDGLVIAGQVRLDESTSQANPIPELYTISNWMVNQSGKFEQVGDVWSLPFAAYEFHLTGDSLLLRQGQDVWKFDLSSDGSMALTSLYQPFGCYGFNLPGTLIDDENHLWIPAFDYGADRLSPHEIQAPVVRVAGGSTFGECLGYCDNSIYVEPNRTAFVAVARDGSYPPYRQYTYGGTGWNDLLKAVDWDTFSQLPETMGCPDCADGGAEWIEVAVSGRKHRVTFEFGAEIESIQPLIDLMRKMRNQYEAPEPTVNSIRYVRVEEDCEGLCRRELNMNVRNFNWYLSDPKGQVRPRNHSERTTKGEWESVTGLVDWRVVQTLAAQELAICLDCPGTEWIEINAVGQTFRIPAWQDEVSTLRDALLKTLDRYGVVVEPSDVTRIGYGSSFGFCFGYCTRELSAENQTIILSASSRQDEYPPIKESMEISQDEWEHLLQLAETSEIESYKEVIGCPDCADGGAEWVSITQGDKEYKVTFEFGRPPESMMELVDMLRGWMGSLPTDPTPVPTPLPE